MKQKTGVILAGLQECMRPGLKAAAAIYKKHGQELVITSGLEDEHSAGSKHYCGKAVDMRTYYFADAQKDKVLRALKRKLGLFYKIAIHNRGKKNEHIHMEYRY